MPSRSLELSLEVPACRMHPRHSHTPLRDTLVSSQARHGRGTKDCHAVAKPEVSRRRASAASRRGDRGPASSTSRTSTAAPPPSPDVAGVHPVRDGGRRPARPGDRRGRSGMSRSTGAVGGPLGAPAPSNVSPVMAGLPRASVGHVPPAAGLAAHETRLLLPTSYPSRLSAHVPD